MDFDMIAHYVLLNKLNEEKSNNEKMLLPKSKRLEKTIEDSNFTISQLFKEKITGKLPEKTFYSLMQEYEQEQVRPLARVIWI